jgi:hypothetical protein
MDAFLDAVLALVTTAVIAAAAIPLLVLGIELFYAPIYVSLPVMAAIVILGGLAWRLTAKRRRQSP